MMVLPEVPKRENSLTKIKVNGHSITFQVHPIEFLEAYSLEGAGGQYTPFRKGWGEGVSIPG